MLYKIALCLFIFGAVITGLNSSGLFPATLPEAGINQYDQATVEDLSGSASGELNPLFTLGIIQVFVSSVIAGVIAVLSIIPLMMQFGVPLWMAMMIQGPIWFVCAWDLFSVLKGQPHE